MRPALAILSAAACLALLLAQLGAYLEFVLVPAPTPATTGPQGPADIVFGLLAVVGGGLGFLLVAVSATLGLIAAGSQGRRRWLAAIIAAGGLALFWLAASAFVLIGLPRNPYHPFVAFLPVPLATLAFTLFARTRRSPDR